MTTQLQSTAQLPISYRSRNEWTEITPGERFRIRVTSEETKNAYSMLEIVADHRNGTPMHVHENEDEHFIVLEGKGQFAYGDKTVGGVAGTTISVSKGVPHAWCNLSESPLRMLVLFTPGSIDEMFRRIAKVSENEIPAFFERFGTRIVGSTLCDHIYTKLSPRTS